MKRRFLVCAALLVLFTVSSALLPDTQSVHAATGPIYWGALVHGAPGDLSRWSAFETAVQKKLSILHRATSGTWGIGNALQEGSPSTATVNGQFTPFPTSSFEAVRARFHPAVFVAGDEPQIDHPAGLLVPGYRRRTV